jgi:hypothetical protein
MSQTNTPAPVAANARANSRPMPAAPAVIKTRCGIVPSLDCRQADDCDKADERRESQPAEVSGHAEGNRRQLARPRREARLRFSLRAAVERRQWFYRRMASGRTAFPSSFRPEHNRSFRVQARPVNATRAGLLTGGFPMKLFTAVVLAVSLAAVGAASADAPPAKPMMKKPMASHMTHKPMMHTGHMHMWPMCKEGMNKMACVCKGATAKASCKGGQWCHTWAGACTM